MTGGELGELDEDDAAVLLALELGGIEPHKIADWPHAWRIRSERLISAKRRAERKRAKDREKSK